MTSGGSTGADDWAFVLLGPMEVWHARARVPVNAPREQALLAVLLLNAGRVVAGERLMELVWGDDPPAGTRDIMHTLIWRLRRKMGGLLATSPPGYVLRVRPDQVDVHRFEAQLRRGRRAVAAGRAGEAAELLGSALALWRGDPLAGVAAEGLCRIECPRLAELRLQAVETRIDALLALGEHPALVGELSSLVAAHPLREGLSGQLMTALYRCGRQAEALEVYHVLRRALDEELGVEPGAEVRRLHQAVLRADPTLELPPPPTPPSPPSAQASGGLGGPAPAQLPADVAGFSGRDGYLAELDGLLSARDSGGSVAIAAIDGTTGVGKTALAVHWAHRVRDRFPHGQLHLNLRGHGETAPMSPAEALSRLLRALGVAAGQIPVDADEAAALYRTLLADCRMLVVLDNASSADQVRPLLPGSPGCLVLVTSRDQLGGLVARDGAHRLGLGVLGPAEAEALLATMLGVDRVEAERDAAAGLASACARLPLALRIAAANIAGRSGLSIGDYLAELVQGDRLSALAVAGDKQAAVQAAFDLSYQRLTDTGRRMFRLLGLVPGPDVSASGAAVLAGTTVPQARDALSALANAHLVEESPRGRYAFHDLLRLYARQLVTSEDSEPDRHAARRRLVAYYLSEVDAAAQVLYPEKLRLPLPAVADGPARVSFDGPAAALAWLDAERPNLTAAVADAAEHGLGPMAWLLADALRGYFYLSMHTADWHRAARAGLAAAHSAGDHRAQAAAHLSLADLDWRASRHAEAIGHYAEAVTLSQQAGWTEGEATALGNLATVHWQAGRLDTAAEHCRRALALHRRSGSLAGQAITVGNLGTVCWQAGRLAEAAQHHGEALVLNRKSGSLSGQALALSNLGETHHLRGRLDDALDHLRQAHALHLEVGDRGSEAETLRCIAAVHRDAGRLEKALELGQEALTLAERTGAFRHQTGALNTLGRTYVSLGDSQAAAGCHQRALELAQDTQDRYAEVEALLGLAATHHQLGHCDQALTCAARAHGLAVRCRYRVLAGQALTCLAEAHLSRGDHARALSHARDALAVQAETGYQLDGVRTRAVLTKALRQGSEPAATGAADGH